MNNRLFPKAKDTKEAIRNVKHAFQLGYELGSPEMNKCVVDLMIQEDGFTKLKELLPSIQK